MKKNKSIKALMIATIIPSMLSTTSVAPSLGHKDILHNEIIQTQNQGQDQTKDEIENNAIDLIMQASKIITKEKEKQTRKLILEHSNVIDIKKSPTINELEPIKRDRLKREKLERIKQEKIRKRKEKKKRERKINEYNSKIQNINSSSRVDWFIQYKQLQDEYSDYIQKDTTIYDVYDSYQLELLFRIVETEVRGDCYFSEKANVASVIFNRLRIDTHNYFPDTLVEVLTEYPQFESYLSGAYQYVTVTETTKLACEYAYQIGDTTGGALWFDSTDGNSWADNHRHMLFKDYVGHAFYN